MKSKAKVNSCLQQLLILFSLLLTTITINAAEQVQRYRGEYTLSHDVDIFCTELNFQCYWLSSKTDQSIRQKLQLLSDQSIDKPYQSVCVVIEGEIDHDTKADSFAADYNGMIIVSKLFASCDQTNIVTQGELQHHRWELSSINGESVDLAKQRANIPALDFGEHMWVSANSGCAIHSGQARLSEHKIIFSIHQDSSKLINCSAEQKQQDLILKKVLNSTPEISINSDKDLFLRSGKVVLKYQLHNYNNY